MSIKVVSVLRCCPIGVVCRNYATKGDLTNTLDYFKTKKNRLENIITMTELKETLNQRLGHTAWLEQHCKISDQQNISSATLQPSLMSDSFTTALIELSKDRSLQDKYVTFLGHVRLGRLMEDLDIFAVWVAFNHLTYKDQPLQIVTLLVDSIDFVNSRLAAERDIRVSGFVSWCGKSTIETELWMEQENEKGDWHVITNARFLLALRDPRTNKASLVNQLKVENDFERNLLDNASRRRKLKRMEEEASLIKLGPNPAETKIIHQLMYENVIKEDRQPFTNAEPEEGLIIEKAGLSTTVFSHPEDRNIHNTVFGGFLMRMAVELSWTCAWLHSGQRPQLERIGDIRFHKPVAVASLLRMRSFLIYSEDCRVVVEVSAFVHDPETGETFRTNDFYFTYLLENKAPTLVPHSYESALMYLDGRRRLLCA